jgi:hypothetical protein
MSSRNGFRGGRRGQALPLQNRGGGAALPNVAEAAFRDRFAASVSRHRTGTFSGKGAGQAGCRVRGVPYDPPGEDSRFGAFVGALGAG